MRTAATFLLICSIALASSKGDSHPVLEGNTAGQVNYYVQWISLDNQPKTCFINKGRKRVVKDGSEANLPASFRYEDFLFRADGENVVISSVTGTHVETISMNESIFVFTKGSYAKIKQTEEIRELMKKDYHVMGDDLITYLKNAGKLSENTQNPNGNAPSR